MQRLKYSKLIKILSTIIIALTAVLLAENYTPGSSRALSCADYHIVYLHDFSDTIGSANYTEFSVSLTKYFTENIATSYIIEDFAYDSPQSTPLTSLPLSTSFDASHIEDYELAVATESDRLVSYLGELSTTCATSQIILAGYGSGAHVIMTALESLPEADSIFHIALLGSPLDGLIRQPSNLDTSLVSRIYHYCTPGDLYCSSRNDLSAHFTYVENNLMYTAAINIGHHIEQTTKYYSATALEPALPHIDTAVLMDLHTNMADSKDFWYYTSGKIKSQNFHSGDQLGLYFIGDVATSNQFKNPTCTLSENCDTVTYERVMRNPPFTLGYKDHNSILYSINHALSGSWRTETKKNIVIMTNSPYYEDDLCWPFDGECQIHYEDVMKEVLAKNISIYVISEKPELASVYSDMVTRTGGQFFTTSQQNDLLYAIGTHPYAEFTESHYTATVGQPVTLTLDLHDNTMTRYIKLNLDGDTYYEKTIENTCEGKDVVKEITLTFDKPMVSHTIEAYAEDGDNKTTPIATATLEVIETPLSQDSPLEFIEITEKSDSTISLHTESTTTPDGYLLLADNTLLGQFQTSDIDIVNLDRSIDHILTVIPIIGDQKTSPTYVFVSKNASSRNFTIPTTPDTGVISL